MFKAPAMLSTLLAATVLASATPATAQLLQVQTTLSEPKIAVGETVTLQITVTSKIDGEIEVTLQPPTGLVERSRQQSRMQSVSWSSQGQQLIIQQIYSVEYQAESPGRFTIGPVMAKVGRRRAKSQPITLTVLSQQALTQQTPTATPNEVAPPDPGERELFVRYRIDRSKPYLGQAVLLDLDLVTRPGVRLQVESIPEPPEVDGFWTQLVEKAQSRLVQRKVEIRGQTYNAFRVWRVALYPLRAGPHVVPSVEMVLSRDAGLFRSGTRLRRRARPVRIDVKPLPSEDRPSDFVSTNVGRYRLTAKIDQSKIKAGKALLYTLRLSGTGNIASAKLPEIDNVPGFRVFASAKRDEIEKGALKGYKEAEYLLMPQKGGRLTIPRVTMSTFDPKAMKYRRLKTRRFKVTVEGTPDPTTMPEPPKPVAAANTNTGLELKPLRFSSSLASAPGRPWRQAWFWGVLFLPALGSAGLAAFQWNRRRSVDTSPQATQRSSIKSAKNNLDSARADVDAGRLTDAHAKIADALRAGGSQVLGLPLQGLTFDAVAREASARGLSQEDARDLVRMLEAADYARYAPSQLTDAAARADIYRAEQLLATLTDLSGGER